MKLVKGAALAAGLLVLFFACDNPNQPVQAGLGQIVDLSPPALTLESHEPNAFVKGRTLFWGSATDDIGVTRIEASVNDRPFEPVGYDGGSRRWSFELDTRLEEFGAPKYPDGSLTLKFKVWDGSDRNPLETPKFAFRVKNGSPALEFQIPYVASSSRLGGESWAVDDTGFNDADLNSPAKQKYTGIPSNSSILGMVSDLSGIAAGYPKIRFWPAYNNDSGMTPRDDADGPGAGEADAVQAGGEYYWTYDETDPTPPVEGKIYYGGWQDVQVAEADKGLASFNFRFPLRKYKLINGIIRATEIPLPVGKYRFQIMIRDNAFEDSPEVIYPVFEANTADYPNRFVELQLLSPVAVPEISLYDVDHDGLAPQLPGAAFDHTRRADYIPPHPYIDHNVAAYKSGVYRISGDPRGIREDRVPNADHPYTMRNAFFVFRIKAAHTDGIKTGTLKIRKEGNYSQETVPFVDAGINLKNAAGQVDLLSKVFTCAPPPGMFTSSNPVPNPAGGYPFGRGPGTYSITVSVTSRSEVEGTDTFMVVVDPVLPYTRLENIISAKRDEVSDRMYTVNDYIKLKGLATDDDSGLLSNASGKKMVKYFLLQGKYSPAANGVEESVEAGSAAADYLGRLENESYIDDPQSPQGIFLEGSPFISPELNTTGFPDGDYTLFIVSQDNAYNRNVDKYSVKVDQNSDKPAVEIVGMNTEVTAHSQIDKDHNPGNIFKSSAGKFTIRLQDDDALDLNTLKVKITGPVKLDGTSGFAELSILSEGIPVTTTGENRASFELTQAQLAEALYAGSPDFASARTLRDGEYTLTVTVGDTLSTEESGLSRNIPSVVQSQAVLFVKDTADPKVAFTSPGANSYQSGLIDVKVMVTDHGPIDASYLKIRLPSDVSFADASGRYTIDLQNLGFDTADGLYKYAYTIHDVNVGTAAASSFPIQLQFQDIYGRLTSGVELIVQVDADPPVVNILENDFNHLIAGTENGTAVNYVNGVIRFKAGIFDGESGLPSHAALKPRWWLLPEGASAPVWNDAAPITPGYTEFADTEYTARIDTRLYPDGAYKLYVLHRDKAGNTGSMSFPLFVKQSTDLPVIDLDTLIPYRGAGYNSEDPSTDYHPANERTWAVEFIAAAGILISGTVRDDDAAQGGTVEIQYWDGTGIEPPPDAPDGDPSWKAVPALSGAYAPTVTAAGNELRFSRYLPSDTVEGGAHSGFLGSGEGKRKYRFRITDGAAKLGLDDSTHDPAQTTAWQETAFILDRVPPVINFDAATPSGLPQGTNFDVNSDAPFIKGTITESYFNLYRFINYTMYIDNTHSIAKTIDVSAAAPYAWAISYKEFEAALKASRADGGAGLGGGWYGPADGLPDVFFTVKFEVTDDSGSIGTKDWTFNKDSSGPEIAFNINNTIKDPSGAVTILKDQNPVLKGSFRDNASLYDTEPPYNDPVSPRKTFKYRLDYEPNDGANWIEQEITAEIKGSTVNWEIDVSQNAARTGDRLSNGLHYLDIFVEDRLGNDTYFRRLPFKIDNKTPAISAPYPAAAAPAPVTPVPAYKVSGDNDEVRIDGEARDALLTGISAAIGLTGEASRYSLTDAVKFDQASYKILYSADSGTTWSDSPVTAAVAEAGGIYKHTLWRIILKGKLIKAAGGGANYQSYSLYVTAHDEASRTGRIEYRFIKDLDSPVISLNTGLDGDGRIRLRESNPRIQGSVSDPSLVAGLTAVIQPYAYGADWNTAAEISVPLVAAPGPYQETVNWTLDLSGAAGTALKDGRYRLRLDAKDGTVLTVDGNNLPASWGNTISYPESGWREFYIDRSNPALTLTGPPAAGIIKDTVEGARHHIPVTFNITDFNTLTGEGNGIRQVQAKLVPQGIAEDNPLYPYPESGDARWTPAAYAANYTNQTLKAATKDLADNTSIANGLYTLYVKAEDDGGRTSAVNINVTIDNEKPVIEISDPVLAGQIGGPDAAGYDSLYAPLVSYGALEIIAETNDNNSMKSLKYSLGQTPPAAGSAAWRDAALPSKTAGINLVEWNASLYMPQITFPMLERFLPSMNPSNEYADNPLAYVKDLGGDPKYWELPLYFRLEDTAGNIRLIKQIILIDPEGTKPRTSIEQPAGNDPVVGGTVTVTGTSIDNEGIYDISFRVVREDDGTPIALGNTGYELHAAANNLFTGGSYTGKDRGWYHYIPGGNGIPPVSGMSPGAWSFTINDDGECNPSGAFNGKVRVEVFTWDSRGGDYTEKGDNYGAAAKQTLQFSANNPSIENLELTASKWGTVDYNVFKKQFAGTITLDADVYVSTAATGGYTITYTGEEGFLVTFDHTETLPAAKPLPNNAGTITASALTVLKTGFTGRHITAVIDPEKLQSGGSADWGKNKYTGHAGTYFFTLKVEDKPTDYWAEQRFDFKIDNYHPKAALTGDLANSNPSIKGVDAVISGTFNDDDGGSGVKGIEKLVIWFTDTGNTAGIPLDAAHTYMVESPLPQAYEGDSGTTNTPIALYPKISPNSIDGGLTFMEEQYYSGVSVDYAGESTADKDKDHHIEFFDPLTGQWSVRLDTTRLGSGPVRFHYAVFDEAGNGRYYWKDIVISNFGPTLNKVILHSDIYGRVDGSNNPAYDVFTFNGDMAAAEAYPGNVMVTPGLASGAAPSLTVRNKYLSFTILVNNGNTSLNYRVTYTHSDGTAQTAAPKQILAQPPGTGGLSWRTLVFSGADFGPAAIKDTSGAGARFEIKVWDNVNGAVEELQLSDAMTMTIKIDNDDEIEPRVYLHDLNPTPDKSAKTAAAAAQPGGIGGSRDLPGVYNRGTAAAPAPSGHIEPRQKSVLGNELGKPSFPKDTVSGAVILRGTASDEHRVTEILLDTGGGTPVKILEGVRNAGTNAWELKAANANAYVFERFTLEKGHEVEWAYVWDTETEPSGLMVGDVTVTAQAKDNANPGSGPAIPWDENASTASPYESAYYRYNQIGMTLAPFIVSVSGERSTQGWYSYLREETASAVHTVRGYNLKKGGNSTLKINGGDDLVSANADSRTLQFQVSAGKAASTGKIVVTTAAGGAADVNSRLTRINPWNMEDTATAGQELWDNSRFAHIWRANGADFFAGSNGGSDFAMAVNPGDAGLWASWVNTGLFRTYYSDYNNAGSKSTTSIITSHDSQKETDVFVNTAIHANNAAGTGVTVAYNNTAVYTHHENSSYYYGAVTAWDKNAAGLDMSNTDGNGYRMENIYKSGADHDSDRFHRPRVVAATAGSGSRIHVSYYDSKERQLKYSYNNSGDNKGGQTQEGTVTAVDGGPSENVGLWSGIDYLSSNQPVMAYYSDTSDTVKLAYYNGSGTVWTRQRELAGYDYIWPSSVTSSAARGAWLLANYGIVNGAPGTGNSASANAANNTAARVAAWDAMPPEDRLAYLKAAPDPWTETWGFTDYIWLPSVTSNSDKSNWLRDNFGITGTDLGTANNDAARAAMWETAMNPAQRLAWLTGRRNDRVAPLKWDDVNLSWPDNFTGDARSVWLTQHYGIENGADGMGTSNTNKIDSWTALSPSERLVYLQTHPNSATWEFSTIGSTSDTGWKIGDLMNSNDDYYRGSGRYVSIRVERSLTSVNNDIIHVAFFNVSNNTLVYAAGKVSGLAAAGNNGRGCFNFTSTAVDTGLRGGNWADISLTNGVPWISYRDQTGFRVAYKTGKFTKPSADLLGHDNKGWDAVKVPVPYTVDDGRLNIESIGAALISGQGWDAAVGYPALDYFRVAYHSPLPWYANPALNPVPVWWEGN